MADAENIDYTKFKRPVVHVQGEGSFLLNLDIPGRKTSGTYIVLLFVAAISAAIGYLVVKGGTDRTSFLPLIIPLFAIILILVFHKRISTPPRNWLSPEVWFVAVYCVFHFSYIILYAFNLVEYDDEVFFAPPQVTRAVLLCIFCLCAFLIGYEIKGNKYHNSVSDLSLGQASHTYIFFAKIMITIASIFFWAIIISQRGDLAELKRNLTVRGSLGLWGRFFWVSYDIAVAGIIIYCVASGLLYQKFMTGGLYTIISLGFIAAVLLSGDRGGFTRFLPIPILAFHYFQRRIKLRWLVTAALGLIFLSTVIATVRRVAIFNVAKMAKTYQETHIGEHSAITTALVEFGGSIKVVSNAMEFVPSYHAYWKGTSYLNALQVVLPNIIPGIERQQKGLGSWLNEQAFGSIMSTHGRGGSIVMEAYMNFGFIGAVVFFVLLGAFYRSIYERFLAKPDFVRSVLIFGLTSHFMLWMRNTVGQGFRGLVWSFVVAVILQAMIMEKETNIEYGLLESPD